jgi:Methyltransferase domain
MPSGEIFSGAQPGPASLTGFPIGPIGCPANLNCRGYDYLDELISGILRFEDPSAELVQLQSEMVSYQPTPARHIFDLIGRAAFTERDCLIDLGSGLGHVTLTASICSKASCSGIELEPSYVACARKSARSLNLNNVRFMQGDARAADLSDGTLFYLYTPFTGTILQDVLKSLRHEAASREIRICMFGTCMATFLLEEMTRTTRPRLAPWCCSCELHSHCRRCLRSQRISIVVEPRRPFD